MAIASATIEALKPKIFAMFAQESRPTFAAIRAADTDYSTEAARKGSVITTPIDEQGDPDDVVDVVTGMVPPSTSAPDYNYHNLTLDKFKEVRFVLEHQEVHEVIDGIVPSAIRRVANSFARFMNREVCRLYRQIPYYIQTKAAGKLFDGDDLDDIKLIDAQAATQEMPIAGRKLILDAAAYSSARSNGKLRDYDKVGSPPGMDEMGYFASRGYQFYLDQQIEKHSNGDLASENDFLAHTAQAAGSRSITIDAVAHGAKDGDILRLHGTSGAAGLVGAIKGDVSNSSTSLPLYHPSLVDVANDARLQLVAQSSIPNNLLCTPGGLKVAVRTITSPIGDPHEMVEQDPLTGLPFVMNVWQGHKQVVWSFSILYGMAVVQPWRCMRILDR